MQSSGVVHDRRTTPRLLSVLPVLPVLTALSVLSACGGGDPAGPDGGSGSFSATIDGQAWVAQPAYINPGGMSQQAPGHFPAYGARLDGGNTLTGITLNLTFITGPGTYPLGTAGAVAGGIASLNVGSAVWQTPLTGDAGTVTISSIGNGRVAGTFAFTAVPSLGGGATGTKQVTNGQFNVALGSSGGLQVAPASQVGTASVTLGGTPWKAATLTAGNNQGALTIIFGNQNHTISLSMGPYNGAGTYPLSYAPFHRIMITPGSVATAPCCWGGRSTLVGGQQVLSDVGTITVTSATGGRVRGTFTATLAPGLTGNQTTNLVMTNGAFDVPLP